MSYPLRRLLAGLTVVALATTTACGDSEDSSDDTTELTPVTYLTSFGTFGRDAYAYVALEKGYFAEAGLDVTVTPGTGTVDAMKLVAAGQADYSIADLGGFITTMASEPMPVRAVAAIHQRSLAAIASLDGKLDSPEKLAGAQVADSPSSTVIVMFPAYAQAAGIDPASVTFIPSNPQALPQLLAADTVDGVGQFVVGQALLEKAAGGRPVTMLPYADELPDLYGNGLVTSQARLDSNRDEVERFATALFKGLAYAVENPQEAAQILVEHVPTADEAVAAAELESMKPYVLVDGTTIGQLDEARVERMIEIFAETGTLPAVPATSDIAVYDLVAV